MIKTSFLYILIQARMYIFKLAFIHYVGLWRSDQFLILRNTEDELELIFYNKPLIHRKYNY